MIAYNGDITRKAGLPASGDILLVEGASWLSDAIRTMTTEPGEGPTRFSHTGLILTPPVIGKGFYTSMVVEALGSGVKVRELSAYKGRVFEVWRYTDASLAGNAVKPALDREGERYGYTKLILHLADWVLLRNRFRLFRRASFIDRWPICSYLVAEAYAAAGYPWPCPSGGEYNPRMMTPDDVSDSIRASGEWWRVWPRGSR